MKRTQLYLDEELWSALHSQARREGTTISELVRQAARARYLGSMAERNQAMQAIIGIRKSPTADNAVKSVRTLRRGSRLDTLLSQRLTKQ